MDKSQARDRYCPKTKLKQEKVKDDLILEMNFSKELKRF